MALYVLALSLALSAPAPFPKSKPATNPVGAWTLNWGHGGNFQVTFAADGGYTCDAGGRLFSGNWRLEGRLLVITETEVTRDVSGHGTWCTYRIKLDPDRLRGKIEGGDVTFELGPPSRVVRVHQIQ